MPKEPDWEDYLEGDSELSRLYQSASEEPPAAVDEKIRDAAHDPRKAPRRGYGPFSSSWRMPAAAVAVMVLCVGVVLIVENQLVDQAPSGWFATKDRVPAAPTAPAVPSETAKAGLPELPGSAAPEPVPQRLPDEPAMERADAELKTSPAAGVATTPSAMLESVDTGESVPETWLQRIVTLFENGDTQAARRELALFKQRYPDYPDAKLQRLLAPYLNDPSVPAGQ